MPRSCSPRPQGKPLDKHDPERYRSQRRSRSGSGSEQDPALTGYGRFTSYTNGIQRTKRCERRSLADGTMAFPR